METIEDLICNMDIYLSDVEENIRKLNFEEISMQVDPISTEENRTCVHTNCCQLLQIRYSQISVKYLDYRTFNKRLEKEIDNLQNEVSAMTKTISHLETELNFVKEERNDVLEELKNLKRNKNESPVASRQLMKKLTVRGTKLDIQLSPLEEPSIDAAEFKKSSTDHSEMEDKFVQMKLKFAVKCEEYMKIEDDLISARHTISRLTELVRDQEDSINHYKTIFSSFDELNKLNQISTLRSNTDNLHILDSTSYCSNQNSKTTGNAKNGDYSNLLNSINDEVVGVSDSIHPSKHQRYEITQSYKPAVKQVGNSNLNYGMAPGIQLKPEINLTSCLLGNVMKASSCKANNTQAAQFKIREKVDSKSQQPEKESQLASDSLSSKIINKEKDKEPKQKKGRSILTIFKKLI